MEKRARSAVDDMSRAPCRTHGGDPSHVVEEARAVSGPTRSEAREDDRGVRPPERDPYQDEGGEG
jgi:hypothetical protein